MPQTLSARHATKLLYKRAAVVFDFDDTLAPDTISTFVEPFGLDADHFWQERVQSLLHEGWNPIPVAFFCLIEESRGRANAADRITREWLIEFGRGLEFFGGVPEMFDRRQHAAEVGRIFRCERGRVGGQSRTRGLRGRFGADRAARTQHGQVTDRSGARITSEKKS